MLSQRIVDELSSLLDHTPNPKRDFVRSGVSYVAHFVLWLFVFLPLAWVGMFTVLLLFTLGTGIAIATRFPLASVVRLLIPTGDYGWEAQAWLAATLSLRLGFDWKPRPKLAATSPTGEAPALQYVQLRFVAAD